MNLVVILLFLLAGCGVSFQEEARTAPAVQPTVVVTTTPVPVATAIPTATQSPTATAAPTTMATATVPASTPVSVAITVVCPCQATPTPTAIPAPVVPTPTPRPIAKAVPAPYTAPSPVPVQYCQQRTYPERRADGIWIVTQHADCSYSQKLVEGASAPAPPPAQPTQLPTYGQPPQPQIPHPALYVETGIGQTHNWTLPVDPDKVLVVGGFRVNGRDNGVYKAWPGGQTVVVEVTDGFAAIVKADWAKEEFCFRIGQARKYSWAHSIIEPLPGWPAC